MQVEPVMLVESLGNLEWEFARLRDTGHCRRLAVHSAAGKSL
jgi:hypothetical protein